MYQICKKRTSAISKKKQVNIIKERVIFSKLKIRETTKYLIKPIDFNWKSRVC